MLRPIGRMPAYVVVGALRWSESAVETPFGLQKQVTHQVPGPSIVVGIPIDRLTEAAVLSGSAGPRAVGQTRRRVGWTRRVDVGRAFAISFLPGQRSAVFRAA
ncbi:MAG: hypothetical protein IPH10_04545 [bacterium]|nr:hypothetical protein [bacterium]